MYTFNLNICPHCGQILFDCKMLDGFKCLYCGQSLKDSGRDLIEVRLAQ